MADFDWHFMIPVVYLVNIKRIASGISARGAFGLMLAEYREGRI